MRKLFCRNMKILVDMASQCAYLLINETGNNKQPEDIMRRSSAAQASEIERLKDQFIVGGQIDHAAIEAFATKNANQLWNGKHIIYKSKEEMTAGFIAEVIRKIS